MCNLYRLRVERWEIADYNQADESWRSEIEVEKDYVAPGGPGYVIRYQEGRRVLDAMRWGHPNPAPGKPPITNIRNYSKPFWRNVLTPIEHRCLVPVTEFQEWTVEPDPETGKKRPHWFSLPSRPVFNFAGAWQMTSRGPVFGFLTCGYDDDNPAAHVVGRIHPKACPVILHQEEEERWLTSPIDDALGLACTYPSQLIAVS